MLYVSTRNINNTYTAYRALNEENTPDGGLYAPYRIPVLSAEELYALKRQTAPEIIADILNLFFSAQVRADEVEAFVGKVSFEFHEIHQNVLFAEMWHTLENNSDYLIEELYGMMTGKVGLPKGWAYIAIEIALLFGVFGTIEPTYREFDMAIPADDLSDLLAALYAKDMGLPVNKIICICGENDAVWDLVNKGEFSTNQVSAYMEYIAHKYMSDQGVNDYLEACTRNGVFCIDEASVEEINTALYAAVVSAGRIDTVISSMYRANGYHIDSGAALAYGGLQDYRASIGRNEKTVILSKNRPENA